MTLLVVGSTGTLGCMVAGLAHGAGEDVLAMVRDPRSAAALGLQRRGVRLCVGDLKQPASLEAAVRGARTVVITATATLSRRDGDSLEAVDGTGLQALIGACERHGVGHVVFVSFSRGIDADTPLARFKRAAERRIEGSGLQHSILLPSYFPEKFMTPMVGFDVAKGRVRIFGDGTRPVSYVATADVARLATACALRSKGAGVLPMGGPRAWSQLQAVAEVERLLGRRLALDHLTLEQIDSAMRQTADPLKQSYLGLYRGLAVGDPIYHDWWTPFGLQPTPLQSCLQALFPTAQDVSAAR